MLLKILGSSSAGNCYILENNKEALMIECGLPISIIKKSISDITKIKGVFISHRHMDHKASASKLSNLGVQVYANQDVIDSEDIIMPVEAIHGHNYKAGGFEVMPFDVIHNVPNLNYMVKHRDLGILVFITDTADVKYRFNNVNHMLIEANYSNKHLTDNEKNEYHTHRVMRDHMSIEKAVEIVQNHSTVSNVVLIHLSDTNSNSNEFKELMEKKTGVLTYVADKGVEINLTR